MPAPAPTWTNPRCAARWRSDAVRPAEIFAANGALDRLEAFAAAHGAAFYGLPRNRETITLVKAPCPVPKEFAFGDETLVPFRAGDQVGWSIV